MAAPDLQPCYADQDKDGYGGRALQLASQQCSSPKGVLRAGDCDDQDPTVYPRARELTDGRDNDCDGRLVHQERDRDGDGLFASEDCDDLDALRHKGADEHPADGVDQDCDGQELCYQDLDRDLWGSTETVPGDLSCQGLRVAARSGDCEDRSAQIAPELPERADGKDSDCDGVVDEGAIVTMDPAPPQKPTPSPDVTGPPPVQLRTPKLPLPPYAKLAVEGVLANKKTTLEVSGTILDPDKRCRSPSMVWKSTNPSALEHVVQLSSWSPDRGTFNIQVPIAGDGITRITYTISCRVDGVPTRLQIANGTSWFYVSR